MTANNGPPSMFVSASCEASVNRSLSLHKNRSPARSSVRYLPDAAPRVELMVEGIATATATAEKKNEPASIHNDGAGPTTPTRMPAIGGPSKNARFWQLSNAEFV